MCIYIYIYIYVERERYSLYIYIYTYIYIERERERDDTKNNDDSRHDTPSKTSVWLLAEAHAAPPVCCEPWRFHIEYYV